MGKHGIRPGFAWLMLWLLVGPHGIAQSTQNFFSTLGAAYQALGFDPRAPGSAVVVVMADTHVNLWSVHMPISTNLDARLVSMINAMDPPPTKVLVLGDITTTLAPVPGWKATWWSMYLGTNEMALWRVAVGALTNVAMTNVIWIPGNHEQLDFEEDADVFRQMYPEMPVRAVIDVAGVRFYLMNCGNFGGRNPRQLEWFRQAWQETPPGMQRMIGIHVAPFLQRVTFRGLGLDMRDVIGDYDGTVWTVSGHEHAYSLRTYRVGRARVASLVVGTANPLATNGRSYDTGCALLCLSNGVRGIIYWHLADGRFRVVGTPNWQAMETYAGAFEDTPGLLWRRLKARGQPPEVMSLAGEDAVEWYAYVRELVWSFAAERNFAAADEFLLLALSPSADATVEVRLADNVWAALAWPRPTNGLYRFPLPEATVRGQPLQIRYRSSGNNDFIGGWGLARRQLGDPGRPLNVDWARVVVARQGESVNLWMPGDAWTVSDRWSGTLLVSGWPGMWVEPSVGLLRGRVPWQAGAPMLSTQTVARIGTNGTVDASWSWRMVTAAESALRRLELVNGTWAVADLSRVEGTSWRTPEYSEQAWDRMRDPLGYGRNGLVANVDVRWGYRPSAVAVRGWFRWDPASGSIAAPTLRLRSSLRWSVWWNGEGVGASANPGTHALRRSLIQSDELLGEAPCPTLSIPLPGLRPGMNLLAVSVQADWPEALPRAYWSFDAGVQGWSNEISGQVLRMVGTNLGPIAGRWGGAVSNWGVGSYLEAPESGAWSLEQGFTVGGWFAYGEATGDDPASFAVERPGEFALYYTGTRTNRYRFRVGTSEVQDRTFGTRAGQWRFVVGWYDGTHANIQVDNGPVWSEPAFLSAPEGRPIQLLRRAGPQGGLAADDVFFYGRVLTAAERSALYREGVRRGLGQEKPDLWFEAEVIAVEVQPPVLTNLLQPMRVVGRLGGPAVLECGVASLWPVAYQWLHEGRPVSGATNRWLRWDRLSRGDAGLYSVIASHAGGAVTSAPVHLVVARAPTLAWEGVGDARPGALRMTEVDAEVGVVLETSTNLLHWREWHRWDPGQLPESFLWEGIPDGSPVFFRLRLY